VHAWPVTSVQSKRRETPDATIVSSEHHRDVDCVTAPPAVTEYLAECLWPGVTEEDLAKLDLRARAETQAAAAGDTGVSYLGSILMPSDEVVFFVFSGPSTEAVEVVAAATGIPFERIVTSVRTSDTSEREEP
jgi:hypothetical protein